MNKKSETFKTMKTMIPFDSFEVPITKKLKKKLRSHSRTASFKGSESNSRDLTSFFGLRKSSLIKNTQKDSEGRFYRTTKKSVGKFDLGSKILKFSQSDKEKNSFRKHVMNLVTDFPESQFSLTKSDMRDIFRSFFDFFARVTKTKELRGPRTVEQGCQTKAFDIENAKLQARRLIIDSEKEMPHDEFLSTMIMLCQKEILLDEILAILNEEDIDLNNLLSITLERIEANHYDPPSDISLESGLSLVLEDKMRMPTPKWQDSILENQLKIDLSQVIETYKSQSKSSKKGNLSKDENHQLLEQFKGKIDFLNFKKKEKKTGLKGPKMTSKNTPKDNQSSKTETQNLGNYGFTNAKLTPKEPDFENEQDIEFEINESYIAKEDGWSV